MLIVFLACLLLVVGPIGLADAQPGGDEFALGPFTDLLPAEIDPLYRAELETLGPEHAAEHLAMRQTAAAAERSGPGSQPQVTPANKWTGGKPSQVGRWTESYFTLSNYAIHSALLHNGKVLCWGYPPYRPDGAGGYTGGNDGLAAIWDPRRGDRSAAIHPLQLPTFADWDGDGIDDPTPFYCAGQSFLADDEVLIVGGNLRWPAPGSEYTQYAGAKTIFTFNPKTEQFTRQVDNAAGRWYPSQVLLGDGRTVIVSGFTDQAPGKQYNDDVEVFTPGATAGSRGTIANPPSAALTTALYPHLFTLPDGNVLLAGPNQFAATRVLDTHSFTWSAWPAPASQGRTGGNAVLLPRGPAGSDGVVQIGGFPGDASGAASAATNTTEIFDVSEHEQGWKPWAPLAVSRSYQNTVLLPNRTMVAIGGGTGYSPAEGSWTTDATARRRRVELYNPKTSSWRLGPSQREDRSYHSTALLLPDGRVFSAGDDHHPYSNGDTPANPGDFSTSDKAEIYSPPYLFKGPRPRIRAVSKRLAYGRRFGVIARGATSAVLVSPGSATHGVDMSQRLVPLRRRSLDDRGMNLRAPANANIAPPGFYMLFVLRHGVPSVARWVHLAQHGAPKSLAEL